MVACTIKARLPPRYEKRGYHYSIYTVYFGIRKIEYIITRDCIRIHASGYIRIFMYNIYMHVYICCIVKKVNYVRCGSHCL